MNIVDKTFIPKAKLTIKNVDKLVSIEARRERKEERKNGFFKLDLSKKTSKNVSLDRDKTRDVLEGMVDQKTKKLNLA